VAFVSHNSHMIMGGQRSMVALIEHLDRTVVAPLAIVPEPGELADRLRALDCPVTHVPLQKIKPRTAAAVWRSIGILRAVFAEQRVDIVAPDAARDAFTCGLARVGTPTRMVWFVRLTSRDPLDVINQFLADGIIGCSADTRRRLWRVRPIRKKHRTILEGADPRVFRPAADRPALRARLGLPGDRVVLLYAGQVRAQKGVLDIVDALALLGRDLPAERMPLLLVIGTPVERDILARIDERIAAGGVAAHVQVLPHQSGVHEWMQAADILVSGSHQHTEGLSRVLYEAMGCGSAVIATDIAGNRDALTPETGILVPEKSPAAIARAVRVLLDDPARRAALGARGVRRMRDVFDIRQHARGVERYFREVLRGPTAAVRPS
jgi:glycosyltransferase involved in cell wall biosynthesis